MWIEGIDLWVQVLFTVWPNVIHKLNNNRFKWIHPVVKALVKNVWKLRRCLCKSWNINVQVYCWPCQVKAGRYGLSWSKGTIKKAEYQSITINYIASYDTKYKTVFVFGTTENLEITLLFMALWSWQKSISLPVS